MEVGWGRDQRKLPKKVNRTNLSESLGRGIPGIGNSSEEKD